MLYSLQSTCTEPNKKAVNWVWDHIYSDIKLLNTLHTHNLQYQWDFGHTLTSLLTRGSSKYIFLKLFLVHVHCTCIYSIRVNL